jgi:hypothetical protein
VIECLRRPCRKRFCVLCVDVVKLKGVIVPMLAVARTQTYITHTLCVVDARAREMATTVECSEHEEDGFWCVTLDKDGKDSSVSYTPPAHTEADKIIVPRPAVSVVSTPRVGKWIPRDGQQKDVAAVVLTRNPMVVHTAMLVQNAGIAILHNRLKESERYRVRRQYRGHAARSPLVNRSERVDLEKEMRELLLSD